ncbi:DUF5796 family protein [Halocalculus aciditolerans]|uniref:Uncharacterized protein n=1 Tax=Halocalculus aciditolerans TaxID=1383812 RepID=A0A830FGY4_9EURY|nr:DUF5796 family protein [Halocalculus aciditolerans]GGL54189.1 hypothetical protein GCM10009039_10450 [Halocalculus aciditolerans]
MTQRTERAPDPLTVELDAEGVFVEYADGRRVFYNGVPEKRDGSVRTAPERDVHVLVTDAEGEEGVLVYVNDRKTDDAILEESGVGRVLLDAGDEESIFPGVVARQEGYAVEITADLDEVSGRVFVFEESDLAEYAYEIVRSTD